MGRREPSADRLVELHQAYKAEMADRAGPAMTMKPLVDKEIHYIEETISALKKIEEKDCAEDVWETIQAAIEDLESCI